MMRRIYDVYILLLLLNYFLLCLVVEIVHSEQDIIDSEIDGEQDDYVCNICGDGYEISPNFDDDANFIVVGNNEFSCQQLNEIALEESGIDQEYCLELQRLTFTACGCIPIPTQLPSNQPTLEPTIVQPTINESPTPIPTILYTTSPPIIDYDYDCYSNLDEIALIEYNLSQEEVLLSTTIREIILCPNTVYVMGRQDFINPSIYHGGYKPINPRPNSYYKCGYDGSSLNNCIIHGGDFAILSITKSSSSSSDNEDNEDNDIFGVVFQGLTIQNNFLGGAYFGKRGNIEFRDCIFRYQMNLGTIIIPFGNSDNNDESLLLMRMRRNLSSSSKDDEIITSSQSTTTTTTTSVMAATTKEVNNNNNENHRLLQIISTPAPIPIPTPAPVKQPPCLVCPNDADVANPDVTFSGFDVTCRQIQDLGRTGDIFVDNCPGIRTQVQVLCGCLTANPTQSPTPEPTTQAPTPNPTTRPPPTLAPTTIAPTKIPTPFPTPSPTKEPTKVPTPNPSPSPTKAPTPSPTTRRPTIPPTTSPSLQPSGFPTGNPSNRPSVMPTQNPSGTPTLDPSMSPSIMPSRIPSGTPTADPSVRPSFVPSRDPTTQPSIVPTENPSSTPSVQSSLSPTTKPSSLPSRSPSLSPTILPSHLPSSRPSVAHSSVPSLDPSQTPSLFPSRTPSLLPSLGPTATPSALPSISPSESPSRQPSESPSSAPSVDMSTLTVTFRQTTFVHNRVGTYNELTRPGIISAESDRTILVFEDVVFRNNSFGEEALQAEGDSEISWAIATPGPLTIHDTCFEDNEFSGLGSVLTTGNNTMVDVDNNFGTYMPGLNGTCQFLAEITSPGGDDDITDFVSETRQENIGGGGSLGGFNCTDFDALQCEAADPPTRSPSAMPSGEPSASPVEPPSYWEGFYDTPSPSAMESGSPSSTDCLWRIVVVMLAVVFGTTVVMI